MLGQTTDRHVLHEFITNRMLGLTTDRHLLHEFITNRMLGLTTDRHVLHEFITNRMLGLTTDRHVLHEFITNRMLGLTTDRHVLHEFQQDFYVILGPLNRIFFEAFAHSVTNNQRLQKKRNGYRNLIKRLAVIQSIPRLPPAGTSDLFRNKLVTWRCHIKWIKWFTFRTAILKYNFNPFPYCISDFNLKLDMSRISSLNREQVLNSKQVAILTNSTETMIFKFLD